jgi:hypothetical protein
VPYGQEGEQESDGEERRAPDLNALHFMPSA